MTDSTTAPWGLEVTLVEVRDVQLPERMRRAMAREAEVERERRARIVSARGDLEAATARRAAATSWLEQADQGVDDRLPARFQATPPARWSARTAASSAGHARRPSTKAIGAPQPSGAAGRCDVWTPHRSS